MGGARARLVYACDEDFERMPEVAGGRHCARCDRTIVDLRAVTQRELDALAPKGSICARVRVDGEGVVLARPPELVPLRRAAAAVAVAATLAACEPEAAGPEAGAPGGGAPGAAELVAAPAPAIDPGPPMLPMEMIPDAGADAATGCVMSGPATPVAPEIAAPTEVGDEEAAPTAEQRARTRRKRRGAIGPSGPPPHFHGGVIMFDH